MAYTTLDADDLDLQLVANPFVDYEAIVDPHDDDDSDGSDPDDSNDYLFKNQEFHSQFQILLFLIVLNVWLTCLRDLEGGQKTMQAMSGSDSFSMLSNAVNWEKAYPTICLVFQANQVMPGDCWRDLNFNLL